MSGGREPDNREDLSVPEKILLAQDLWDEIARTPQSVVLTLAQREEAECRLKEHEAKPQPCFSWEEIKRRLESSG